MSDPEDAQSVWNSLEIAKLVVSALTPIVILLLGVYFTRSSERRARRETRAVERSGILQRLPLAVSQAGVCCTAILLRRTLLEALLQVQSEHPDRDFAANISDAERRYEQDREKFDNAIISLNEVASVAAFLLSGEVNEKLCELQNCLSSLLQPNEHLDQLRSRLIERYESSGLRLDFAAESRDTLAFFSEGINPIEQQLDRLRLQVANAVRAEIAA